MARVASELTASTHDRRRFRLLVRLAKAGDRGLLARELYRCGGSGERREMEQAVLRLTLDGLIEEAVAEVPTANPRFQLTDRGRLMVWALFPDSRVAREEPPTPTPPVAIAEANPIVWKPDTRALHVDPSPHFWTTPEPDPPTPDSTPESTDFWAVDGVMSVNEVREAEGFWS